MCPYPWWRFINQFHGKRLDVFRFPIQCIDEIKMYTRASASDYDDFQAEGWSTKELIPLMKKHETYQRACNNRDVHGFEGTFHHFASKENTYQPLTQDLLKLASATILTGWLR